MSDTLISFPALVKEVLNGLIYFLLLVASGLTLATELSVT